MTLVSNYEATSHTLFDDMKKLSFNIFIFTEKVGRKNSFTLMAWHMMATNNLLCLIDSDKFSRFITDIYKGYRRDVAYHNDLHGADVA